MTRQQPEVPFCSVTPFDPVPLWTAANETRVGRLLPRARRHRIVVTAGVAVVFEAVAALALTFT